MTWPLPMTASNPSSWRQGLALEVLRWIASGKKWQENEEKTDIDGDSWGYNDSETIEICLCRSMPYTHVYTYFNVYIVPSMLGNSACSSMAPRGREFGHPIAPNRSWLQHHKIQQWVQVIYHIGEKPQYGFETRTSQTHTYLPICSLVH